MTNTTTQFGMQVIYKVLVQELETQRKEYLDFCREYRVKELPVFEFLNRNQTYKDAMKIGFDQLLWQQEETIITKLKRIS